MREAIEQIPENQQNDNTVCSQKEEEKNVCSVSETFFHCQKI